jgi:hypothetical protein
MMMMVVVVVLVVMILVAVISLQSNITDKCVTINHNQKSK